MSLYLLSSTSCFAKIGEQALYISYTIYMTYGIQWSTDQNRVVQDQAVRSGPRTRPDQDQQNLDNLAPSGWRSLDPCLELTFVYVRTSFHWFDRNSSKPFNINIYHFHIIYHYIFVYFWYDIGFYIKMIKNYLLTHFFFSFLLSGC